MDAEKKKRFALIIKAYPLGLILIGVFLNMVVLGVEPVEIALPSRPVFVALVLGLSGLVLNHIWLMTSTELTRLKYGLHATPEEWVASGKSPDNASPEGLQELRRHHNAHQNATENTVYFALAAFLFSIASPPPLAAFVWIGGFVIGRLGHAWAYLNGRDDLRGLFMSVSLASLFGMVSYLVFCLVI